MKKEYPKVLVLGVKFADNTADGVTLTNLFKGWPKVNLLSASDTLNIDFCEKNIPCDDYFEFHPGKLNQINKKPQKKSSLYTKIRKWLIEKSGIEEFVNVHELTPSFLSFLDKNKPDAIYSAVGSVKEIIFLKKIYQAKQIPLIIHIYDDWPQIEYSKRFFKWIWAYIYKKQVQELMDMASCHLSICDAMSKEYEKRYGHKFYAFHNPVEASEWDITENNPAKKDSERSVFYMGKINFSTLPPLIDMAKAVERLNKDGYSIFFRIVSPHLNGDNIALFEKYPHVKLEYAGYKHSELPALIRSHSFLFLPLGFQKDSVQYYRYSMLTKLSEYLISAVPIILYCPKGIALYDYCMHNDCAQWSDEGERNLYTSVKSLLQDKMRCKIMSSNAYKLAIGAHSAEVVRENFRKVISQAVC